MCRCEMRRTRLEQNIDPLEQDMMEYQPTGTRKLRNRESGVHVVPVLGTFCIEMEAGSLVPFHLVHYV